jgi:hypothetical protein
LTSGRGGAAESDTAPGDTTLRYLPIGAKEGFPMTHQVLRFGALPLILFAAASCTGTIDATQGGPDNQGSGASGGTNPTGAGGSGSTPGAGTGGSSPTTGGAGGAVTTGGAGGTGGSLPTAGTGSSTAIPDPASSIKLEGAPAYYRVMRLTNEQWTNSVQSVLRLPSAPTLAEAFQNAVSGLNDFDNNELLLGIDSRGWTDFQAAAESLATLVTSDAALLSGVYPGMDANGFITTVGRRAYRRPLTPAEVTAFQALFDSGAALSGNRSAFAKGASVVLEAMLQSPHFLYRTELGAAGAPLSGYELAAKLSLWLRNTTPDDALLDGASAGSLDTVDGVAAAAQQLLEDPAARSVMRTFHSQLLHFDQFSQLSKVGVANWDATIKDELAESSFLFFDRLFSQGLGVADMFRSTTGFVGPRMAALLGGGNAPPAGTFAERDFSGTGTGYFTQLPFLMLHANNANPNSIIRGVSMAIDVLCSPLGPPEDVVPPLPQRQPGQTNRQVVNEHTSKCGLACHNAIINPLGFAFENFDGMGKFRDVEEYPGETLTIDASGTFEFAGGTKSWQDADGFMEILAAEPQSHICYSRKIASYGLQRDIVVADAPLLTTLATASLSSNASLKQLMLALVRQDAFRTRVGGVQ